LKTFPIKNFQGKICLSPFVMIEVQLNGGVRMCGCAAWLPSIVGNLKENTLHSILSSPEAQKIRQSIIDGTYQYCNEKMCGVITNNSLNTIDTVPPNIKKLLENANNFEMPHHISFPGDRTCNLSCPSCRTRVIKTPDDQIEEQIKVGKLVCDNLFSTPSDQSSILEIAGAGELFASPMMLSFVNSLNIDSFPNLKLHIGTNGLLAPARWHRLDHIESIVTKVTVSIDAAKADTYEKIRRGGTWSEIIAAMKFLQNKKHQTGMALHTRMIVQQQNYTEIKEFYDLCQEFGVDIIEYSRLQDWGTWNHLEFTKHDVFDQQHPEFASARQMIDSVKSLPGTWFSGL